MTGGLSLVGVSVNRGDLTVCREITLDVPAGEITVLLGANGAGKSTLLAGIAGVLPLAAGTLTLDGRRLEALPPHRRARAGLASVEQGRTVFSRLTVAQHLAVVDRSPAAFERAIELFPRLAARRDLPAGRLSGGEQQMLVIARALAMRPRVLVLDELSLGLAPSVVAPLLRTLADLAASGTGILLVEQFVDAALRVGTTAHLMEGGRIVRSVACQQLARERAEGLAAW